jgi:hypothetical protein
VLKLRRKIGLVCRRVIAPVEPSPVKGRIDEL